MTIITTDEDVLIVPQWLILLIGNENGELIHPTSLAKLQTKVDPDGDHIIGQNILTMIVTGKQLIHLHLLLL